MRPDAPNPCTWWFLTKLVPLSFHTLSHLLWWFQTSYLLMANCFSQPSKDSRNVLSARAISYIESEVILSLLGEGKLGSYQPPLVENQTKKLESRLDSPHICQILCFKSWILISISSPPASMPHPYFMLSSSRVWTDSNSLLLCVVCCSVTPFRKSPRRIDKCRSHHSVLLLKTLKWFSCISRVKTRTSLTKDRAVSSLFP